MTNTRDPREERAHELVTAMLSGADVSRDLATAGSSSTSTIGGSAADPEFEAAVHAARGTGRPLENALRAPIERATGFDFGAVRVHADVRADRLTRSVGALAFTTGNHVFFRSDTYAPTKPLGQALLAHELTHVMDAAPSLVQRADDEPGVRGKLASAASAARGVAKRALGIGREAQINRYLKAAAAQIDEWKSHYGDQNWFTTVSALYTEPVIWNYAHAIALVYMLALKEDDSSYRGPKRASRIVDRIKTHQERHLRWLPNADSLIQKPASTMAQDIIADMGAPLVKLS